MEDVEELLPAPEGVKTKDGYAEPKEGWLVRRGLVGRSSRVESARKGIAIGTGTGIGIQVV